MSSLDRHALQFSLGLLATCLAVGYGVHHLYPFYAFDMYTRAEKSSSSRLIALDSHGKPREIRDFQAWRCVDLPAGWDLPGREACGPYGLVDTVDRKALNFLRTHSASPGSGETVRLVRRVWTFPHGSVPGGERDCPIATCQAVP
jgi:hypothetical protein